MTSFLSTHFVRILHHHWLSIYYND